MKLSKEQLDNAISEVVSLQLNEDCEELREIVFDPFEGMMVDELGPTASIEGINPWNDNMPEISLYLSQLNEKQLMLSVEFDGSPKAESIEAINNKMDDYSELDLSQLFEIETEICDENCGLELTAIIDANSYKNAVLMLNSYINILFSDMFAQAILPIVQYLN